MGRSRSTRFGSKPEPVRTRPTSRPTSRPKPRPVQQPIPPRPRPNPIPISQQQKPQIQPDRSRPTNFGGLAGTGGKQPDRSRPTNFGGLAGTGGKQPDRSRPTRPTRPTVSDRPSKPFGKPTRPVGVGRPEVVSQGFLTRPTRTEVVSQGSLTQATQQQPPKQLTRLEQAQKLNRQTLAKEKNSRLTVTELINQSTENKKGKAQSAKFEADKRRQKAVTQFDFGTNVDNPPQSSDSLEQRLKFPKGKSKENRGQIISEQAKAKSNAFGFNFGSEVSSFVQHFPQTKIGQGLGKVQGGLQEAGEGVFDVVKGVGENVLEVAGEVSPPFVVGNIIADNTKLTPNPDSIFGTNIEFNNPFDIFPTTKKTVTRTSSISTPKKIRKPVLKKKGKGIPNRLKKQKEKTRR